MTTVHSEHQQFEGGATARTLKVIDGRLGDAYFDSSDRQLASKIIQQVVAEYTQKEATDVAAETKLLYVARKAGTLQEAICFVSARPAGGDKTYTLDIKKSTAGGAFATILSATTTVTAASPAADRTAATLAIAGGSLAYLAGDAFEVVVTVAGSTGTQGQGFLLKLIGREAPE